MARRGWAEKIVAQKYGHEKDGCIAGLIQAEHARAVRIAKQVVNHAAHMVQQTVVNREANAYWQGKLDGAENILAALQKGRA